MDGLTVRPATAADLARITEIYNHYIVHTPATFDLEPWTATQREEWFTHYDDDGPHRVFVAEEAGSALGAAWSSSYRPKRAYDTTVETSVYCAPEATGRGIGRALYTTLFAILAEEPGLHRAIAAITQPNEASMALHRSFGFTTAGTTTQVGFKFDQYWDVTLLERRLP